MSWFLSFADVNVTIIGPSPETPCAGFHLQPRGPLICEADNSKEVLICHEKGWSKSVLVYALHSLENVLGLVRFRVFVPNMYVGNLLFDFSKVKAKNYCTEDIKEQQTKL